MANVDCLSSSGDAMGLFTSKQLIIFLSPIVMGIIVSVVLFVYGHSQSKGHDTTRDGVIGSILIGLTLMYPTLVKRGALLFACRSIGGEQFLDEALDVACYGPSHVTLIISLGLPSILLYILGFPRACCWCCTDWRSETLWIPTALHTIGAG